MKQKIMVFTFSVVFLSVVWGLLFYVSEFQGKKEFSLLNLDNIIVEDNKIDFDSLNLKQKIAQMIIVRGDDEDFDFNKLNVGGIFLDRQNSEEDYKSLISDYQDGSKIKLFVSTDLEGSWTPFRNPEPNQLFPYFSEIKNADEAEEVGLKHGELLKEIGFNLNFAPVSEYSDEAYGGRTFLGTEEEVLDKIGFYVTGLQKNIFGTCKHYPGNALIKNLHFVYDAEKIYQDDLDLFDICVENEVSSIMVSHQIVSGVVDSNGKPSSVSEEVISTIDDSVLIIADEINMAGLRNFYSDKTELYVDLINSGENLILDFDLNPFELYKLLEKIEIEVNNGNIDEKKIDDSVRKILVMKGYFF